MALFIAGLLIVCMLAFAVGLKVGVKNYKEEISVEAQKKDLRYKIKAPSLLAKEEPERVKPERVKIEKPSIETVIEAASEKKALSGTDEKAGKEIAGKGPSGAKPKEKVKDLPEKGKIDKKGGYFVQVAAFRAEADAQKRVKKLSQKGYKAVIVKADVPGKGTYHRVRIGPFAALDEAKAFALKFEKKEKVSTYIPAD